MKDNPTPYRIGLVGTGVMGRGIAQILAEAGQQILLFDAQPQAAAKAKQALIATWQKLAGRGKLAESDVVPLGERLTPVDSLEALADCGLVIEAIIERLDAKQALFSQLEAIVADEAILATNTSSLSVTAIAARCRRPERIAGLHFFNPVPLMRIVEIIGGVRTGQDVIERLRALIGRTRHAGVVVADTPGFLINHAGRGYNTEALRALGEGVAPHPEIDLILREQVRFGGNGFKLGPFELLDVTGLDVSQPVMESIYRQFYEEPRFRPSVIAAQRFNGGLFGRKTGEGFYRYDGDGNKLPAAPGGTAAGAAGTGAASAAAAEAGAVEPSRPRLAVYVDDERASESLNALVERLGAERVGSPSLTGAEGLVLIAPLGEDASSVAARRGLPAERTIAIDTLFDPADPGCIRRVLMPTVATRPAAVEAARALFAADGVAVSVIRDSTGFIAQRVVAMIVSIATEIAQQRIASPADIDLAVRAGLGYPAGPLTMGDQIGPDRILTILEAIHANTADPRYRPGPWLRRRAELGLSLLHED